MEKLINLWEIIKIYIIKILESILLLLFRFIIIVFWIWVGVLILQGIWFFFHNHKVDTIQQFVGSFPSPWRMLFDVKIYEYIIYGMFIHIFLDYVHEHITDERANKWIRKIFDFRFINKIFNKLGFGDASLNRKIIRHRNMTIITFSEIDDYILDFYRNNKGKIYLFNPQTDFLIENSEFKDIHQAIKENKNNIEDIIIISTTINKAAIDTLKSFLGFSAIKLIQEVPDKLTNYLDTYVAAIYTEGEIPKYYFNRPLYPPYNAKIAFIQSKQELESITFEDDLEPNLNISLLKCIKNIEECTYVI